jgi:hypothetical protein
VYADKLVTGYQCVTRQVQEWKEVAILTSVSSWKYFGCVISSHDISSAQFTASFDGNRYIPVSILLLSGSLHRRGSQRRMSSRVEHI